MDNIPSLDDLLNYGAEYQYPNLITSDYFRIDNGKENNNNQQQELDQQTNEKTQEHDLNQQTDEQLQEQESEQATNEETQEQDLDQPTDEQSQKQELDQQTNEEEQPQETEKQTKDENDFDALMDNYDENNNINNLFNEDKSLENPSDKLNDIHTTKIYKVLRKLVSLSYERYQKGTYKYDKKEIVKHYLTNQKFRIIDDLISPTFKPDVYVFDLSPSNDESLEMYVNAISSFAIKNSLIYLTYNDCILRKLTIKKECSKGINVNEVANSQVKKYKNFDCKIFDEYCSLYNELKDIKNRKIYIFSDFDISYDISKLSQENQDIVWFSTEKNCRNTEDYFYRQCLSTYVGYYVETSGIDDIEKFILEKNKNKYRKRPI